MVDGDGRLHDLARRLDRARHAVSSQEAVVTRMVDRGQDAAVANMVLAQFQKSLRIFEVEYQALLSKQIDGAPH